MITDNLIDRITTNPDILVGKPIIRGMRISVEQILKLLANGMNYNEIIEDYPELEFEDIQAVLLYAAELVSEEKLYTVSLW